MKRLYKDSAGSTSVELVYSLLVLLLLSFGIYDFGRAMFDWNATLKAAERGAQAAVVRDPIALPLKNHFACNPPTDGELIGELCVTDAGALRPECDYGNIVCDESGCTAGGSTFTYSGDDTIVSSAIFDDILLSMRSMMPRIEAQNVSVSYRASSLGFIGMPVPVSEVTVEVTNVPFSFFGLDTLIASFTDGSIDIPVQRVTLTAEDLSDNSCEEQGLNAVDVDGRLVCQKGGGGGGGGGGPPPSGPLCFS